MGGCVYPESRGHFMHTLLVPVVIYEIVVLYPIITDIKVLFPVEKIGAAVPAPVEAGKGEDKEEGGEACGQPRVPVFCPGAGEDKKEAQQQIKSWELGPQWERSETDDGDIAGDQQQYGRCDGKTHMDSLELMKL